MAIAAGDIAFVALSADNGGEGFAFVVLRPIAAGESIRFVEGAKASGAAITTDTASGSQIVWTNGGTALQPGTIVQLSAGVTPSTNVTVTGGGSITAQPIDWNISSNGTPDSLFAVTGTAAVPGTFIAAALFGDTSVGTLTSGASIVTLAAPATNPNDVNSINSTVASNVYANPTLARAAYTNSANWVRDTGINNGTGTNNAEWPALTDPNSPLFGKTGLAVENVAPAVTTIIASGAGITAGSGAVNAGDMVTLTVNTGEAVIVTGTPTLTLNSGGTATYDAAGSTATALKFTYTVAAGQNAADMTVTAITGTIKDAAGNSLGFNTASTGNPAGTLVVDTVAPTATTTIGLVTDTGTAGDGISSNPALGGTSSVTGAGQVITIKDGATVIGTTTTAADGSWSFANAGASQASHSYTAAVTDTAGNLGAAAATTPGSVTLDTTADSNVVVDLTNATAGPTSASIAFDLANLDAGSTATVTFTGVGGGTVSGAYTSNGAKTADISGLQGDVTATVSVTDAAGNTTAGTPDTLAGDPVCFYPGTLVRTPSGDVAVEALQIGDLVLTHAGQAMPIRWMGRQTIATRFADPLAALPIRIRAGALAEGLPERDLLVSPSHAILLHGVLVQAGALVNGTSIRREAAVPAVFTYHHVELAEHALVLAEGVPAESYVANVERLAFDNAAEHAALYGAEATIPEMDLPRALSHRQVPMAVRAQLAKRAAALDGATSKAA